VVADPDGFSTDPRYHPRCREAAAQETTMADDDRIRKRAHQIWEAEGRPHGRDREHWEQATRELAAESGTGKAAGAAKAKPAGKPGAKSTRAARK
jgi:hypothetical protein